VGGGGAPVVPIVHIFAKALLAFLTGEHHLHSLFKSVILLLGVTLGAIKPFFAAGTADCHLRVQDVLASGRVRLVRWRSAGWEAVRRTTL
jgi:hypothetical protein